EHLCRKVDERLGEPQRIGRLRSLGAVTHGEVVQQLLATLGDILQGSLQLFGLFLRESGCHVRFGGGAWRLGHWFSPSKSLPLRHFLRYFQRRGNDLKVALPDRLYLGCDKRRVNFPLSFG